MNIQKKAMADNGQSGKEIKERFLALAHARRPFEGVWEEVAEYMGPAYTGFGAGFTPYAKKTDLVDSTARRSANIFAAGMLSGVCSPAQPWFRISTEDKSLLKEPHVKIWLQKLEDVFYRVFAQSGYYSQQTLGYHQTGLFGWQCMYVDEDPGIQDMGIRFRTLPLGEVYIAENFKSEVDTVFRSFQLTARQAAQKWGRERLSSEVQQVIDQNKDKDRLIRFLHAVYPCQDEKKGRENSFGYSSVYMEETTSHIISCGGYNELPYIVTRSHRLAGNAYSYSPGTEALADTKMINEMKRLILEAGQLAVAPPYLLPDDGFLGRFSFAPRAMNYYRRAEGNTLSDFGPLSVGGEPRFSFELLKSTKEDIEQAFYVDLFLTMKHRLSQGSTPSALEVAELAGERMFLLGPLLVNQQQENFRCLFDRLYSLLVLRGECPPAPEGLSFQDVKIDYVSPLMLAQQEARISSMVQTYKEVGDIATVAPEVLDILNHDQNVRNVLDKRGFPQTGIRSDQEVEALRRVKEGGYPVTNEAQGVTHAMEAVLGSLPYDVISQTVEKLARPLGSIAGSYLAKASATSTVEQENEKQERV